MGGTQSKLDVYFGYKDQTYGGNNYNITASKTIFSDSINFEVVTHKIDITKYPTYYDVYLYNCGINQGGNDYIFAYCSPSDDSQVPKQIKVYYSVLAPEDPLVISFFIKGGQWYNCEYSKLLSARWDYASKISKYNFIDPLTKEKLFELYKSQSLNKKIKFIVGGQEVVTISEYKQEIHNKTFYRIIYTPNGKESILGSKTLYESKMNTIQSKCCELKIHSSVKEPKYNNQIDPYYLDSVKGHYYDGIIVYFARDNGTNNHTVTYQEIKTINKKNMAVLLEFVDTYKVKTHIQRIDKNGFCWSEKNIVYKDDKSLEEALKKIKESAVANVNTTFIIEKKESYEGVEVSPGEDNHATYKKYTHKATQSNKPNIIFRRKVVEKIDDYDTKLVKTTTLDVYFLKFKGNEEDWPFIVMFNNEKESKPANGSGGGNGGSNGGQAQDATPNKTPTKRCFYFDLTNDFEKWHELKVTKKSEEEETTKKENQAKVEDLDKELQDKLNDKLKKLDKNGRCQTELYLFIRLAFYILNTDDTIPKIIKKIEEERPKVRDPFIQPGMGRTLPFILGSVFGGVFALGTISAIIYGIYWYNTTIKLLT